MSNIVVDTESPEVSAVEETQVTEAVQEPTTNEQEVTSSTATEDSVSEVAKVADDNAGKFAGKSADEIINSYHNLEKELGRKAQEVGELRKLSDSFLQAEMSRNQKQDNPPTETSEEPEMDFFEDPSQAVNSLIENHPKFKEFQQYQAQQSQTSAKVQLEQTHPDYVDVVQDSKFQEWVQGSKIRTDLFRQADGYNYDAANELLSHWKERSMIDKTQEVKEQQEVERKSALTKGSTESRASADSLGGKKVFRRADLIRMKMEDPAKYDSLQSEIYSAYADGRVK